MKGKQQIKRPNEAKAKKQATHEFFNKTASKGLVFNKAPLNKNEAYGETRAKIIADQDQTERQRSNPKGAQKSKSFLTKLYQDDDEFDELKVLGGIDENDEEVNEARQDNVEALNKRKEKATLKSGKSNTKLGTHSSIKNDRPKIGKLTLRKGAFAMFAVCEIGKDYLIVNHTRNCKGYVPLDGTKFKAEQFKIGQLVVAMVNAEIGGAQTGQIYNLSQGKAGLNRKLQLTLEENYINKGQNIDHMTKGMVLTATVESKEAKGYILNLGFRDQTKGFMKFSPEANERLLKAGSITVLVKSVINASKIVKCELLSELNCDECVQQQEESVMNNIDSGSKITPAHVRPGFLVSGKVSKAYENGVEVTFLGGITGTCFADHLDEENGLDKLKIGTKVTTRIISVDPVAKVITTSMKKNIIGWSTKYVEQTLSHLKVGQKFENVKVQSQLYGDSYLINLQKDGLQGFLHKTQTAEEQKEEKANPEDVEEKVISNKVYEVGHKFQSVKIKEINYFDGIPVLSSRDSMQGKQPMNYSMIKAGEFFNAKIEKVNLAKQYISLSINQFVKGNLHLEHMADNALKQMPPKFQEAGKEISVRVLSVDSSKRSLEFTKKDTLMKADAPVYQSYKEVKKGDKVVAVVAAEVEHGYVVKSFGNIKGLLTFEDVKSKLGDGYDVSQFKPGSILKTYVLFKKRDRGLALTLSKKKAKEASEAGGATEADDSISTLEGKLPTEEQVQAILEEDKYATMIKSSQDAGLVGQVNEFRILEADESLPYHIVKSTDASKKSKNFIAILPKCLITNHPESINQTLSSELTYQGLVLDLLRGQIPVISIQPELIALKDQLIDKSTKELSQGATYVGVVNGVVGKAGQLSVRFLNGIKKSIKVKDLNVTKDYKKIYYPGKVIRVGVNKLERLCTKQKVIEACLALRGKATNSDQIVQISSFCKQYVQNIEKSGLQVGSEIDAEVQLVKDYGIIAKISGDEKCSVQTGFIMNDQKAKSKYKQGQSLRCRVLDIDPIKNIADLSEKLIDVKSKGGDKELAKGSKCKAVVELNKESYLILSIRTNRAQIGFCTLTNFNGDQESNPHSHLQIGDEVEVEVVKKNSHGFYELIPAASSEAKKSSKRESIELKEGIRFNGQIKSIKHQCLYISIASEKKSNSSIGRLHMTECSNYNEFSSSAVGDRLDVKILKVTEDKANGRTWIELTRNQKHMQKLQGLDQEQLDSTPLNMEALKVGKKYDVVVLSCSMQQEQAINLKFSQPMLVQVGPFVRGTIPFNQIAPVGELAKFGSQIILSKKYKIGQTIQASYIGRGQFSFLGSQADQKDYSKSTNKRGDLVTARYVKHIKGRGVTVQIADNIFGFIEACEITDEISGNVVKNLADRSIFAARVIDLDKNGKLQLSTRESVLDEKTWNEIKPEGTSIRFQESDAFLQARANQRNKILKYGASIALARGDLAIGYIVNIGKAGCFIQIGHNCVVRAGLNELSDQTNFDFQAQLPIGTIVLGRITRTHESPTGDKKFDFSTRQSLVVYGVGVTERSKLQVGDEVASIVMALAEGKVFAQIKGTYIKIKVKGEAVSKLKVGDHITSALKKVTKEKISSTFSLKTGHGSTTDMTDDEKKAQSIFDSVKEEAAKDVDAVRALSQTVEETKRSEIDPALIAASNFTSREEQINQQIKDLQELDREDEAKGDGSEDEAMKSQDSDAEEMKRLINYDDESKEAEDENESMDSGSDEEEGEQESDPDVDSASDSNEQASDPESVDEPQSKLKKRTLKDRLVEEQQIRDKEKRMRTGDDSPQDIDDFERLLVADQDQSYLWIQYMAFMLDNVDASAARKVVERAVKSVAHTNDQDKLNIWTAFMNLESNFGTQDSLEKCTKRALELNDRKKIYLNLVDIYKASKKYEYIEVIYKQLAKKYSNNLEIWSSYIEFLIEIRVKKEDPAHFLLKACEFTDPKVILQRALQALTKDQHVAMISKFGMLEFKNGAPESGRTMLEGIVSNYPKRMDIWAIYMDMEMKYGDGNVTQARHLFERCLSNDYIMKKPKKMKLVFQKYMEFEKKQGNATALSSLRERVEGYLSTAFDKKDSDEQSD